MHVLLIHQAFVGPGEPGGTRHLELAQRAVRRGHRFTIIASPVNYLTGSATGSPESDEIGGHIVIHRVSSGRKFHQSFFRRGLAWIVFMCRSAVRALHTRDVDVVLGTSPPMPQALAAWLVAKIKRVPFALEIRDLWPDFAVGLGVLRNRGLIGVGRALEHFLYSRADIIVVNSPAYADHIVRTGTSRRKIRFVPNGVDLSMFDDARNGALFRQRWGLNGKFIAVYAGALGLANDIPTLLRAAQLLRHDPRFVLVLIGDGKERRALQAETAALDLSNVIFTGSIPKKDMPDALASADVCVAILKDIPMFATTYPNKVFDYMAAGRPTVLAIDGVIREVIRSAGAGVFVQPGDAAGLAAAIIEVAENPELSHRMGLSARKYVEKHFNRDTQAAYFVDVLEEAHECV
jgi:glycosyltransferase involved in cell wall biosynthesis